ncbi:MAG: hypothetical protein J0M07_09450 [Anaerolineae bacterium]|nr:hypothetical protein [Anaerolineae bacterium]
MVITLSAAPEFSPSLTVTLPPTAQAIPSGTPIPLPTPTVDRLVTIEGPVNSITDHVITIYGFQIEVEPEHPILQIIDVGNVVRIEGVLHDSGVVLAVVVSNIPDAEPPRRTIARLLASTEIFRSLTLFLFSSRPTIPCCKPCSPAVSSVCKVISRPLTPGLSSSS